MQKIIFLLLLTILLLCGCAPAATPTPTAAPTPIAPSTAVLAAVPAAGTAFDATQTPQTELRFFTWAAGTSYTVTLSAPFGEGQEPPRVLAARYSNTMGEMVDYTPQFSPAVTPTPVTDPRLQELSETPACPWDADELPALAELLGFPILLPGELPAGYQPDCLTYLPTVHGISFSYRSSNGENAAHLHLTQQTQFYLPYEPAFFGQVGDIPADKTLQSVLVGDLPGDYMEGMWTVTHLSPTEIQLVFIQAPNGPIRLRWAQAGRYMTVGFSGCLDERCLRKEDLINIAEGLRD